MATTEISENTQDLTSPEGLAEMPQLYKVVFVNDNTTPMDFVVAVLMQIFGHAAKVATLIMLKVHNEGYGIAGIFPHEIAEAKAVETQAKARQCGYPLKCRLEKEA